MENIVRYLSVLFVMGVAIHWFGWFHGMGVAVAFYWLRPFHPNAFAKANVEALIVNKTLIEKTGPKNV